MFGRYMSSDNDDRRDAVPCRSGLYRSPEFCEQAKRLADVHEIYFRNCIDLLFEAKVFPHSDPDPLVAVAMDMAALLATLAARSDSAFLIADMHRMLAMPFRLSFGETSVSPGRRFGDDADPDFSFGAHLVASTRRHFEASGDCPTDDRVFVTAGRGPDRTECFGTIASYGSPDETSLYSTHSEFVQLHPGVARITALDLDLVRPVSLTAVGFRMLADLMRVDRERHFEPQSAHDMK